MVRVPLAGRRVLVTGGHGFLGLHLCGRLLELGAEVHATTRRRSPSPSAGVQWSSPDLEDYDTVRGWLASLRPDLIYHLSGTVTADPGRELVLPTFRSLLMSTVHLLSAVAEREDSRIVLAASLTEPQGADPDASPSSPYAAAKWSASAYARMFHRLYGTAVVMTRPFMTYGPGQDSGKLIPHVVRCLLREEAPKLSTGRQEMDWIFVDDVVEGLILSGTVKGIEGRSFDLGTGSVLSVRAVVEEIVKAIEPRVQPTFGALPDRPLEPPRRADTETAWTELGWRPETPLASGVAKTIDSLRRELAEGQ